MLLVSMCFIYIHVFCLLTSIYIYMLLKYAGHFSLVLNFMERFKYDWFFLQILCACFILLFVYVYSYVGFKSSLELVL